MARPVLPREISAESFDALHDQPGAWLDVMQSIGADYGALPLQARTDGTVLVAMVGNDKVIKLYPPFLRDHFSFECAALQVIGGKLSIPTPELIAVGDRDGWPFLVMSQLRGHVLLPLWPMLEEPQRLELLHRLGSLAAEVHALPTHDVQRHSPDWGSFLATQRSRCPARQARTGLPEHLIGQLETFMQGAVPEGPGVLLTGEYTPMNLLVEGGRLSGMFDFGDGLVGPREYDWLGPLAFLAAGHAPRCQAFFEGYGVQPDAEQRLGLMRLLLLHRYSHLPAQIAHAEWQDSPSFEALTARIWA